MRYDIGRAFEFLEGSFSEQGMQTINYDNLDEVHPTVLFSLNSRLFKTLTDFISAVPESGRNLTSATMFLERLEQTARQLRKTIEQMRLVNEPDDQAVIERVVADQVERAGDEDDEDYEQLLQEVVQVDDSEDEGVPNQ